MPNRLAYAVAGILITLTILEDSLGYSSLYINMVLLALAATFLTFANVAGNASLSDWFTTKKTVRSSSRGRIRSMVIGVESAESGFGYFQEDLARVLAEASIVRRGESLNPNYDAIMKERGRLISSSGGEPSIKRVFGVHPTDSATWSRVLRRKDETYLAALELAIASVGKGE